MTGLRYVEAGSSCPRRRRPRVIAVQTRGGPGLRYGSSANNAWLARQRTGDLFGKNALSRLRLCIAQLVPCLRYGAVDRIALSSEPSARYSRVRNKNARRKSAHVSAKPRRRAPSEPGPRGVLPTRRLAFYEFRESKSTARSRVRRGSPASLYDIAG